MKSPRRSILLLISALLAAPVLFIDSSPVSAESSGSFTATSARAIPTPTISPSETPPVTLPPPGASIAGLQARIRQRIFAPAVRRGRIGVRVVSLTSGQVVFEQDSDKYFMPASNMKNFTVAAALEKLTPEFRFVTSVYANSLPDTTGTVGDIRIFGRGDVTISGVDGNGGLATIDSLADKIVAAGVRRIEGSIIGDESYFTGSAIPETWEWEDLQWYYGAEISPLPVNDNAVELRVLPGRAGEPCSASISPANTLMQIVNLCTTTGSGVIRSLQVTKRLDRNVLELTGTMPAGDAGFKGSVTFTRPSDLFVNLLKHRLETKGVIVAGNARLQPAKISTDQAQIEIAKLESPPLSLVAAKTMKPSQNMYTETLLWTLGEQIGRRNGRSGTSAKLGAAVLMDFLKQIGVPEDAVIPYDGSGLSRHNLITPSAVTALYVYMAKQSRYSHAWRDSLTIGGVDGTLANRFKGTAAAGNMRGKTGTIDQVSALSGYLTTAGGDHLVISILVNGVAETRTRTALIDDIVVSLANFNGRID